MKKVWVLLFILILIIIFFQNIFLNNVKAGNAGVGVLNVSPQYNIIRLVKQDDTFRVYLTVSDYNSWDDIQSINVILMDETGIKAEFIFKQYVDNTTFDKINEFSEKSEDNNYLVIKKCSYDHSNGEDVEDKCNLNLLFVFQETSFTNINIIAYDRSGATATIQIDFTSEELTRRGNIIIIPGIDKSAILEIPQYFLDIIALIISSLATWCIIRKTDITKIMRAIYEET
jgi:hypothetical protein